MNMTRVVHNYARSSRLACCFEWNAWPLYDVLEINLSSMFLAFRLCTVCKFNVPGARCSVIDIWDATKQKAFGKLGLS